MKRSIEDNKKSTVHYSAFFITFSFMKKQPTIKYLKLPFLFDSARLQKDLEQVTRKEWMPHHYAHNYDGQWNSLALYATGGDEKNIFATPNSGAQETVILKDCLYFKEVISQFKCPLLSVRLLRLSPGSVIKPHKDYCLGYEDDNFRLHIPIVTNDLIEFKLDGEQLKMLPGECWYTNVNFTHSVSNKGEIDRVHLVIDGERNDWSDELFFSLAPKESFALKDDYPKDTIKMMISELQKSKTDASKKLISKLEKKLN